MFQIATKNRIHIGLAEYIFIILILILAIYLTTGYYLIQIIFSLLLFLTASLFYGKIFFKNSSFFSQLIMGNLIVLSIASLIGVIYFYIYFLNAGTYYIQVIIILILPIFFLLKHPLNFEFPSSIIKKIKPRIFLILPDLLYFILVGIIIYFVINSATDSSIRSPWEVVPQNIFLIYFLSCLTLLVRLYLKPNNSLLLLIIHFFVSFSVAGFIYQIGINYDPFIHRRNLEIISQTGTLSPKPFYYIGNYAITIFLNNLFKIPLSLINKFLLPSLASLTIPTTIILAFKKNYKIDSRVLAMLPLIFLILPFSNFIATTPQGLANLFSIIIIFLSLYYLHDSNQNIWLPIFLSLVTITIHPLTGIPILFFLALLWFYLHFKEKLFLPGFLTKSIFLELIIVYLFALPSAFLINSFTASQMKVVINHNFIRSFISSLRSFNLDLYYQPFISIYNLIYTYAFNLKFFVAALVIYSLFIIIRSNKFKKYFIYFLSFLVLFLNYIFLKNFFLFNSLIDYERNNYTERILDLAIFFLLPYFLIAIAHLFLPFNKLNNFTKLLLFAFIALALTTSFYLSYPRVDPISEDHGYSTSITDIETVNFLENINRDKDYIVLANQSVSAAAIEQLGYTRYYQGQFFYPVPTGNQLYQYYQDLSYDKRDTYEILDDVYKLTNVKLIYLVINDYWWAAEDIIAKQKNQADDWFSIDGKNYIFEYSLVIDK